MSASNTYGRQVVVPLTNKSGGGVVLGDVVVIDTTNNDAFTTSTAGSFLGMIGIAQETIANNAAGRVLISGYTSLVNVDASVTRGHYGKTFTVAKQATDAGASRGAGTFCQFLTGGTTPTAVVFGPDLETGSGTALASAKYTRSSTSYTTTSTTFVDIDGTNTNFTITTGAHRVLIGLTGCAVHDTNAGQIYFDIDIDGTRVGGTSGITGMRQESGFEFSNASFSYLTDVLGAGSHTFKFKWRTNAGTATVLGTSATTATFWVSETANT